MSDPLEYVERLAESAKLEVPPRGRVAGEVILRLRNRAPSLAAPLAGFAVVSAIVAATLALFVFNAMGTSSADSLSAFFQLALPTQL